MVLTLQAGAETVEFDMRGVPVAPHGRTFRVVDDPVVLAAADQFADGAQEGLLRLFDAVLPDCDRMVDFGAYVGLTTLYAATYVPRVFAFEASPTSFSLLRASVALNPALRSRIALFPHAVGDRDGEVTLYGRGYADRGCSIFRDVQRGTMVIGAPAARVPMRDAYAVLIETGIGPRTLLKIDVEGAEYQLVPAVAGLLAEAKPVLHVSFHPFNIVVGSDEYANAVARLARAMRVAEALACYRLMYCHTSDCWVRVDPADRLDFLRQYLLRPKQLPGIATPQYGFTDEFAFADVELELA
jgi:FkbM family methyltransferase